MIRQAEILADAFDRVILYEDGPDARPGEGEIIDLLRRGLAGAPRVGGPGSAWERAAIARALDLGSRAICC